MAALRGEMDFYLDVQFLLKHVKKNLWNLSKSDCFDKKKTLYVNCI